MNYLESRLQRALAQLSKVTREYIAEGIPEVDEAIHNANVALSIFNRIKAARTAELPSYEENLGGHWR